MEISDNSDELAAVVRNSQYKALMEKFQGLCEAQKRATKDDKFDTKRLLQSTKSFDQGFEVRNSEITKEEDRNEGVRDMKTNELADIKRNEFKKSKSLDSYIEVGSEEFNGKQDKLPTKNEEETEEIVHFPTRLQFSYKNEPAVAERTIQRLKEKLNNRDFLVIKLQTNEMIMKSELASLQVKNEMLNDRFVNEKLKLERFETLLSNETNASKIRETKLKSAESECQSLMKNVKAMEEKLRQSESDRIAKEKMVDRLERRLADMQNLKLAQSDLIGNLQHDLALSKSKIFELKNM